MYLREIETREPWLSWDISVMRKEKERGGGIPKGFSGQEDKGHQCCCACEFYSNAQTYISFIAQMFLFHHAISNQSLN